MTDPYQPQQSGPGQPMPYGQSYPPVAQEHPQGTIVLVLGIVGIFVPVVSFVAWYMGSKAQKEIRASGQSFSNEQNINIGKILGMVFGILWIIGIVLWLGLIIFAVALGAAGGN